MALRRAAGPASGCLPAQPYATQAASFLQELERLRGELLALRERAGELAAIRDQLTQVGWGCLLSCMLQVG